MQFRRRCQVEPTQWSRGLKWAVKSGTSSRNPTLDGLRLAAAGGIVFLHVSASVMGAGPTGPVLLAFRTLSYVGLYFFFVASGYLHGSLGVRGRSWIVRRFVRLGVPYAFWSAVYLFWTQWQSLGAAASLGAVIRSAGVAVIHEPVRMLLFAGAMDVLWALPVLFYTVIFVELAVKSPRRRRWAAAAAFVVMLAVIQFAVIPGRMPANSTLFFLLAPRFVMVYLLGMEVRSWTGSRHISAQSYYLTLGCALVFLLVSNLASVSDSELLRSVVGEIAFASVALLLMVGCSMGLDVMGLSRFSRGGPLMLGVFVSHMLWLGVFSALVPPPQSPPVSLWITGAWVFTFGLSASVTLILSRFPPTRPLVV